MVGRFSPSRHKGTQMSYSTPKIDRASDMRAPELAVIFGSLEPHTAIAEKWEKLRPPSSKWWRSQKQHMIAWFSQAEGPGAYGRRKSQTAGQTYNRLLCPPALLWIAEALGVDHETVRAAANDAWTKKHISAQCAAIRRYIPWQQIMALAKDHR